MQKMFKHQTRTKLVNYLKRLKTDEPTKFFSAGKNKTGTRCFTCVYKMHEPVTTERTIA